MLTIRISDRARVPVILLPALLLLVCSVCIGGDLVLSRALNDQTQFHLPTVQQFARELPAPNLRSYASATTPGYHLVLSVVSRDVSSNVRVLRCVGSLFSAALLVVLAGHLSRFADAPSVIALCAPLLCSIYFLSSAAWMLPDNAGWLGIAAILVLAARPTIDAKAIVISGAALAALVFVRQAAVWAAVVLLVAAYVSSDSATRTRRTLLMCAATLPAFVIVGVFVRLWGGTVPVGRQDDHMLQFSWAVPAFILALAGSFGWAFLAAVPNIRTRLAPHWRFVGISALLALMLSLIPETTYDYFAGRGTGLWNLTKYVYAPMGRSLLIVGLATLGGATLSVCALLLRRRSRVVFLTTLFAFTCASALDAHAWQRYYEPLLLMVFAMAVVDIVSPRVTRRGFICLGLLSLCQISVTMWSVIHHA